MEQAGLATRARDDVVPARALHAGGQLTDDISERERFASDQSLQQFPGLRRRRRGGRQTLAQSVEKVRRSFFCRFWTILQPQLQITEVFSSSVKKR